MSLQYKQLKGLVQSQQYQKKDANLTSNQASKMLSEAAYDSSLWGYASTALGVGTFLLSGGTSAVLMAGIGGLSSYIGSEYGEQKSLAEADPIVGIEGGAITIDAEGKAQARDEIGTNLDAQQLSQAFQTAAAIYTIANVLDPKVLDNFIKWDDLISAVPDMPSLPKVPDLSKLFNFRGGSLPTIP